MKKSIQRHFGINPNREIYRGGAYNTFADDLRAAMQENALLALCGDIGAGKTTMLLDIAKGLPGTHRIVRVRSLDKEYLGIANIVNALIYDLSHEGPKHNFEARSRQCNKIVGEQVVTLRHTVTLIIENAHRLHWKTLLSLKELREMDFAGQSPLFGIVLIGHPELASKIQRLRELHLRTQYINMNSAAGWMDQQDRQRYLQHVYGELLTTNQRAKVAFLEETPQCMNHLVERKLEQAYYTGKTALDDSDFDVSLQVMKDKLQLSNRDIAEIAGHDRGTVSKVIAGKSSNPAIQDAVKLAMEKAMAKKAGISGNGNGLSKAVNE